MTIRCFTGIPVTDEYRDILAGVQKQLKYRVRSKATWVRPENWHLTLKFLGDVFENTLADLKSAAAEIRFNPFTLAAGRGGFFPNERKPRVVWIGLSQGVEESRTLFRSVEAALAPLGFAPEARSFSAHLTLARIKRNEPDDWKTVLQTLNRTKWPEITVDRFILWQSVLKPQGPEYRILEEFKACG